MTDAEKIEYLTAVTDETRASVLQRALEDAKDAILNKAFPFLSTRPSAFPAVYESKQLTIAKYLLLKQGAEGETAHSENGVSRTYESADIPESMLRDIVPRMKTLSARGEDDG